MTQQFQTPEHHLQAAKKALEEADTYADEGMLTNNPQGWALLSIAHALTGILQQLTDYTIHANVNVNELPS